MDGEAHHYLLHQPNLSLLDTKQRTRSQMIVFVRLLPPALLPELDAR
jgi:hypothetical protein